MKLIRVGKENSIFQELQAIKENRTKRAQLKKFFVEGVQNIKDAIDNHWEIDSFLFCDYHKLSDWAKSILGLADKNILLSYELMHKLSDKTATSEILAIIKMKSRTEIHLSDNPVLVLLDRPSKKGNFGSIIRSCDALNVETIYFMGHSVDIYDHEVITASMGSFFKVPFVFLDSNKEYEKLIIELNKQYNNFQIIATSLEANDKIQMCDFKKPTLLLIGNESRGLSKFLIGTATQLAKIEMKAGIDSLNVACATTVCLFEIARQRSV